MDLVFHRDHNKPLNFHFGEEIAFHQGIHHRKDKPLI
jgi:hypothetical protein